MKYLKESNVDVTIGPREFIIYISPDMIGYIDDFTANDFKFMHDYLMLKLHGEKEMAYQPVQKLIEALELGKLDEDILDE